MFLRHGHPQLVCKVPIRKLTAFYYTAIANSLLDQAYNQTYQKYANCPSHSICLHYCSHNSYCFSVFRFAKCNYVFPQMKLFFHPAGQMVTFFNSFLRGPFLLSESSSLFVFSYLSDSQLFNREAPLHLISMRDFGGNRYSHFFGSNYCCSGSFGFGYPPTLSCQFV